MKKLNWLKTTMTILILIIFSKSYSQGHYIGGIFNTNDYFIPPTSGWVYSLYYSNSKMNYYNDSGSKINSIQINEDPSFSVALKQSVSTHSIIPMVSHFGNKKVLDAKWGVLILPMISNPNANIALDFYSDQSIASTKNINIDSFGLGDLYLQPIWLTWDKNRISTTFSYGFWVPSGKYKTNDSENVGLGYWSHNLRTAIRYKPNSKWSITSALTFEMNTKQKGVDFTEAPHLTFDYGGAYNFRMGHEIGIFGFGNWQMGNDVGAKTTNSKDLYYGLGTYGSYWIIPGKFGLLSRLTTNFGTKNKFGGTSFQIGVNYLLF